MEIWHLRHQDINKARWDRTISKAVNGNIYAWSWYLDAVAPGWEALVNQDYTLVMPLPCRIKYGINYIFQPLLTQQLGLISTRSLTRDDVGFFISGIPKKFRWIQTTLNGMNPIGSRDFNVRERVNYELNLAQPFQHLSDAYHENARRNVKKSLAGNFIYEPDIEDDSFISLLRKDKQPGSRILLSADHEPVFRRLLESLKNNKALAIPGVRNSEGKLISAVMMGVSHNRYHYFAPATTEEGRNNRAMFYLIDQFISSHAGENTILDFEGSNIESLARFYHGFGAVKTIYFSLQINRFGWPLKYIFLLLRHNQLKS